MPWIVGVDEAGYGPNLGPLVMASVALDVADVAHEASLWQTLQRGVRKASAPCDARFVVDDSKKVYSTARGLLDLERSVCGILLGNDGRLAAPTLGAAIKHFSNTSHRELEDECWFRGETLLPMEAPLADLLAASGRFFDILREVNITRIAVCCDVVCSRRFNACVDRWDSKAAILGLGLAEFIRFNRQAFADGDAMHFFVDKHGGRNHYSALLQHAMDDGMVLADEEGSRRSSYQVVGLDRTMTFTFQPEADASHFCVALASMLCKYLREALMREFNAFWQQRVPGLKATAGYPGDALRYYDEIRDTVRKMGLADDAIWRRR